MGALVGHYSHVLVGPMNSDPSLFYHEQCCGFCKWWNASTTYLTKKRICRNPKSQDYANESEYLHKCREFEGVE